MFKICECCGEPYEAQRSTSRFCSSSCRSRYNRTENSEAKVDAAIDETRELMHRLDALSVIGPVKMRPICGHLAQGIAKTMGEVGL